MFIILVLALFYNLFCIISIIMIKSHSVDMKNEKTPTPTPRDFMKFSPLTCRS